MRVKFYVVFLCFAFASAVSAAEVVTFDEGVQLYNDEKYADALRVFTSLEARGEVRAAYALGVMYANGQGVEANIQKASNTFFCGSSVFFYLLSTEIVKSDCKFGFCMRNRVRSRILRSGILTPHRKLRTFTQGAMHIPPYQLTGLVVW